jgi:protein-tyrosine phosphatase
MTRIISHLYLGSKFNAQNPRELRYHGIQTVINVAWEAQRPCDDEFKYIKYHWVNVPGFDILVEMDQIVDQIHHEISEGRNLLVHCAAGKSRSASVIIGYLIKYFKMSFEDAYDYVKAYRGSIVLPNQGFVEQLKKYSSCDQY